MAQVINDYPDIKASIESEATERYEIYQQLHGNKIMFGTGMEIDVVRENLGEVKG